MADVLLVAGDNIDITQAGGAGNPVVVSKKQTSGFFDYNDSATATTPLSVTGGGAAVILTNDELGSFTNKLYPPDDVTDVWDASSTLFDFSDLTLGSKVEYRVDVDLTISGANAEVDLEIELGIGLGAYTLSVGSRYFKTAGTYNVTTSNFLYIGDTNTKNGGGRFKISSSNNMDVKVNGWVCYISMY
jgi:polyisoprenoid-binding protein YceI